MRNIQYLDKAVWFKNRSLGIGGSDVAAILGLSKWKSPLSVYMDKVFPGQSSDKPKHEAMEWGSRLEGAIAAKFFENHPELTMPAPMSVVPVVQHDKYQFLAASPDRLLFQIPNLDEFAAGLECKTSGAYAAVDWEAGEIPTEYELQILHYLYVLDLPYYWLSVLSAGQRYFEFKLEANHKLYEDKVLPQLVKFWDMVQSRTPPAAIGAPGEDEAVKILNPLREGKEISLTEELIGYAQEYNRGKSLIEQGEEIKKKAQNSIRMAMAGAEKAVGKQFKITDSIVNKGSYTVAASSYRQLRITAIKGGK